VRFELLHMGPAHSPEDMIVVLPGEGVVFGGDILFAGRIPFVGEADSRLWLERIGALLELHPRIIVTGHGEASRDPARDLALTRDYLLFLRKAMGDAVEGFIIYQNRTEQCLFRLLIVWRSSKNRSFGNGTWQNQGSAH